MDRLKRLLPDALAGRIVLLLAIAILVANVIALIVLNFQQQRFDQQASEDREIERISALIPAMEAVDAEVRQAIARDASTRFARVRVEDAPLLTETATDSRSTYIARELAETLGRKDVTVAIIDRSPPPDAHGRPGRFRTDRVIAVTIPLSAREGQAEWLNVVTSGAAPRPGRVDGKPFLTILALSLLCVLELPCRANGEVFVCFPTYCLAKPVVLAVAEIAVIVVLLIICRSRKIEPLSSQRKFRRNFSSAAFGLLNTDLGGPLERGCRAGLDLLLSSR